MSDPFSIAAGAVSLVAASWKISNNLRNLQTKFERVPQTVSALIAEFQATTAGLSQLNRLLEARQHDLLGGNAADEAERVHLLQCLDAMTFDMARTFSLIDAELAKLTKGEARPLSLRLRFLWVESDLNGYMAQIRDQRSSLIFLMQSIQLYAITTVQVPDYDVTRGRLP